MRALRNTFISILLAVSMIMPPSVSRLVDAQAAETAGDGLTGDRVTPDGADMEAYTVGSNSNHYTNWPMNTIHTYLVALEEGGLMSINNGSYKDEATGKTKNAVLAGYYKYDAGKGEYVNEEVKTIGLEFPRFGGFHATDKYYFVMTAQSNPEKSNAKEVFRITKFDKDWNNLGSAEIKNCNTEMPFAFGTVRMEESGNYLLARTCRRMYNGHQTNLTIKLNMETMEVSFGVPGYASHSLNQFIKLDEYNNHIVSVDVGDYYSRGVILNIYDGDLSKEICGKRIKGEICAFGFKGSGVYTKASVGGLEISESSCLVAGSSVDQTPGSTSDVRNIFLAAVNKETRKPATKWLTNEDQTSFQTPHLVKISDDEFLMLWQKNGEDNMIYCSKVDGDGNPIIYDGSADENGTENGADTENKPSLPSEYEVVKLEGKLTECAPVIVSGSSLMWSNASSGKDGTDISLYELNPELLKGAAAVSPSAVKVTKIDGIKYPVSTVETIEESRNNSQEEPGGVENGTGSGGSGSASWAGSWDSNASSMNLPYIQGSFSGYGWDAIIAESGKVASAQEGGIVTVNLNGAYQVPRRVLESIRGKNVTLVLIARQGIHWRIYGKDITAEVASDINFNVTAGSGNIPQDVAGNAADGLEYLKLNLAHKGEFGFPLTMSVSLAKNNGVLSLKSVNSGYAGMYANLFSYHADKREMEFSSAGIIGEDGTADLAVASGGDYMLIVSPEQMGGIQPPEDNDTAVAQPEPPKQPEDTMQAEVKSVNLSKTMYTYSGKAKKPSVTAVDTNGQKISKEDYTVSYKNNKKVGKATVTVKFKNGYSGTVTKTFTIRPAGTSIRKAVPLSKGCTVTWKKKTAQTSGYQIQYSANAGFKGNSTGKTLIKKVSVNKKNIKNLKAEKQYYVRIRTYKTVKADGKSTKIYSKWSGAKKVKTL